MASTIDTNMSFFCCAMKRKIPIKLEAYPTIVSTFAMLTDRLRNSLMSLIDCVRMTCYLTI